MLGVADSRSVWKGLVESGPAVSVGVGPRAEPKIDH